MPADAPIVPLLLTDASEIAAHGLTLPHGLPLGENAAALVRFLQALDPRWRLGATGPRDYFCWSMLQLVQFALFGRKVARVELAGDMAPATAIRAGFSGKQAARRQWKRRPQGQAPRHGDGVRMAHLAQPWHVGTFLDVDRGLVLHLPDAGRLALDTLPVLRAKGYDELRFYEWAGT